MTHEKLEELGKLRARLEKTNTDIDRVKKMFLDDGTGIVSEKHRKVFIPQELRSVIATLITANLEEKRDKISEDFKNG